MEAQATDYPELQAHSRAVYTREGCWYYHSQFVRPVTGETRRWGPVAQSGEYAFDTPHLFSTRRIGPDLSRVGLKYSRSEEHTSDLQSLMRISYAVFCLKKKTTNVHLFPQLTSSTIKQP